VLGVLVTPALGQPPGVALDLMVMGALFSVPVKVALSWLLVVVLSVPIEAALDDPVGHCAGRGGAWQIPRCGARRPGGNSSIN
jgi:hypothetical protein